MARPCRQYGCVNHITSRSQQGYCDNHASLRSNWNKREKGASNTTTARGYGHKWRQIRTTVLKRDEYLCMLCKQAGVIAAAKHVDHIVSKSQGGTDDPANLQSLCVPCHETKTGKETH